MDLPRWYSVGRYSVDLVGMDWAWTGWVWVMSWASAGHGLCCVAMSDDSYREVWRRGGG